MDLCSSGRSPHQGAGVGGSPRTPRHPAVKMNNSDSCHNNNVTISTVIRTEPFSDFYVVEEEIGRGKFAVVKRCRRKQSGKEYAAKFLRKRRKGKDCRSDVIHEISMLEMVRKHPRLVDLVEVYETSHELILVTEYASGGELYQHVVVEERIEEKEVRRLMRQVLDGLLFLHDRNTVHLDVKPQNVLLTERLPHGDIKLCDLGFARKVRSGEDVRDIIGTPDYVAPEVLSYEPIHTASDMWSVGVLAYVMLTGYSPFAGDTKQETFLNISQVNIDFPEDLFEDISSTAQEFMMKLLVREPSQRLTARDCLNHQWLQIDEPNVSLTPASPVGQRRALTPPSSDSTPEEEPLKKCKCDDTAQSEADDRKDKLISEDHLLLNSHTPRILEDNNNISSPDSSTSPSLDIEAAKKSITMADQKENLSTATSGQEKKSLKCEGMVYTADATCLSQVEREAELLC